MISLSSSCRDPTIPAAPQADEEAEYELGRQPANTKLSSNKTVRRVCVRGGNTKWRALRLDTGNYSWGSEALTRKTRILDVVYNASRTQTLVKSAIVQVDAAPFKQWYLTHYGVDIGRKKKVHVAKRDDTENAPFFVSKLAIKILPCVILFKKGIVVDRLVGIQDLKSKDDFLTRALEHILILKTKGIIDEKKKDDDDDDEESEAKNRRVRSSAAEDSDTD
uniref:40S ribosomal protein S8 n=1 Tax=Zea mays TaxID=4577 RepID=A0A804N9J5_MAIZE